MGLNLPTYRSFQTENPTPQPPTLPQPFPGRARVEESDLLRPAILALLQGDPIALRKGLGQVDHQAAQHVAQHIPGRGSPGCWMLGPRLLKFGAEVSFWDQPNEITPDSGVCWSHFGSYPVNCQRFPGFGVVKTVVLQQRHRSGIPPRCGKRLPTKPKSKAPTEVLSSKRPTLMPQMARTQIHLAEFWTELDLT